MTSFGRCRVLLVEDSPNYRAELESFLSNVEGLYLAGSFSTLSSAVEALEHYRDGAPPHDVALVDLEIPSKPHTAADSRFGVQMIARLKELWPEVPVIVLTVFDEPNKILRAIYEGADGYLLKNTSARDLKKHLNDAVAGVTPVLTASVARTVLEIVQQSKPPPKGESPSESLTPREIDFLRHLARGKTYAEIGAEIGVGVNTVRSLVRSTYPKLQARTAAHAIAIAFQKGLI